MAARILDGKKIAAGLREEIAVRGKQFQAASGVKPHLTVVLVGAEPASQVYVRSKQKACENAGFGSTLISLPEATTTDELLATIQGLNADKSVHGILVQLPLPKQIDERKILLAVDPLKDVDAFHPENVGLIAEGHPRFLPCTPFGIQQILLREQIPIAGAHVVIVGRSNLVGRPLALMLSQKGDGGDATVTLCHSRSKHLGEHTKAADILVAAIGRPEFITADMIRPGAVVIDVGINRTTEGKLVGDVDYLAASDVAAAITPVPGGVGPMTVTMLLENTLTAAALAAGG